MTRASFKTMSDHQKYFEGREAARELMPGLPFLIRLDGRAFSTFTRGLTRPYDLGMSQAMIDTTNYLVKTFQPSIAYTQSDEISLAFPNNDLQKNMLFGGRIQKLCSIVAATATAQFSKSLVKHLPSKAHLLPVFDARVWSVSSLAIAAEHFIWREADAVRNSLNMAAHAYFSHKMLQHVNSENLHELLQGKGINWEDYPTFFKRGTYLRRETVLKYLSEAELNKIPEKHRIQGPVERSCVEQLPLPPLYQVSNVEEVLFFFGKPILQDKSD